MHNAPYIVSSSVPWQAQRRGVPACTTNFDSKVEEESKGVLVDKTTASRVRYYHNAMSLSLERSLSCVPLSSKLFQLSFAKLSYHHVQYSDAFEDSDEDGDIGDSESGRPLPSAGCPAVVIFRRLPPLPRLAVRCTKPVGCPSKLTLRRGEGFTPWYHCEEAASSSARSESTESCGVVAVILDSSIDWASAFMVRSASRDCSRMLGATAIAAAASERLVEPSVFVCVSSVGVLDYVDPA